MGQKIKYSITEERLARLVSESIEEVLLEAKNDEGLGKFLGGLAGKVRNGVNKFRDDYNASRNAQLYKNRDYDSYAANGLDPNARNFDKTMSQNYRSASQKGASASAPSSFTTQYGDNVGGKRGSNERASQNTLQQMQEMLAALTQQMQTLIQNNNGPKGDTGGAQGDTGGAQGSTEGTQGSTGGAQGSTVGAQGSTGGAQGGTGGSQDSQSIIDRQRTTQNATKRRELSPDEYKTNDGKTSTAAQNDAELHKGTNPDNPYADLEESRKRQLSGKALMEIISRTIKKHLNESWKSSMVRGKHDQANQEFYKQHGLDQYGQSHDENGNLITGHATGTYRAGTAGYQDPRSMRSRDLTFIGRDGSYDDNELPGGKDTLSANGAKQMAGMASDLDDYYSGNYAKRLNKKAEQLGNYGMPGLHKHIKEPPRTAAQPGGRSKQVKSYSTVSENKKKTRNKK